MTTATKPTTLTGQLAKLGSSIEKNRAEVNTLKRDRDAYAAETESERVEYGSRCRTYPEEVGKDHNPLKGTEAHKMQAALKTRLGSPNPHQAELDQTVAELHESQKLERQFRLANFSGLVSEVAPSIEDTATGFEEAFTRIVELIDLYRANEEEVRELVLASPPLNGQDLANDGRMGTWLAMARDALESPVFRPREGDMARWKIDQAMKQELADNE